MLNSEKLCTQCNIFIERGKDVWMENRDCVHNKRSWGGVCSEILSHGDGETVVGNVYCGDDSHGYDDARNVRLCEIEVQRHFECVHLRRYVERAVYRGKLYTL